MNVVLTSTPEINPEILDEVHTILSSVPGEIKFIKGDTISDEFMKFSLPDFFTEKKLGEEELHNIINQYRIKYNFYNDSYIILLTKKICISTKPALFSGNSPKDYSILLLNDWLYAVRQNPNYLIAYKCLEKFFLSLNHIIYNGTLLKAGNGHGSNIGCLGDHNKYTNIPLTNWYITINKMKVADICNTCYVLLSENYSYNFISQLSSLLEKIREPIAMSQWIKSKVQPHKISINSDGLITVRNVKFKMQERLTALYILFLKHKEGIDTFSLAEHKTELHEIYKTIRGIKKNITNTGLMDIINNLCNVYEKNKKGEIISKDNKEFRNAVSEINKELKKQLGDPLCSFYQIILFKENTEGNYYKSVLSNDLIYLDHIFD